MRKQSPWAGSKAMLAKLLAEVEKEGERLPVSLTRLANNLREQLEGLDKPTPAMTQKITVASEKEPEQTQSAQVISASA